MSQERSRQLYFLTLLVHSVCSHSNTTAPMDKDSRQEYNGLSTGWLIAIGSIVFVLVLVLVVVSGLCLWKKKARSKNTSSFSCSLQTTTQGTCTDDSPQVQYHTQEWLGKDHGAYQLCLTPKNDLRSQRHVLEYTKTLSMDDEEGFTYTEWIGLNIHDNDCSWQSLPRMTSLSSLNDVHEDLPNHSNP